MDDTDPNTLIERLGGYGRWQILITALHGMVWASLPLQFSSEPFIVDTPPYRCKIPTNSTFNDTIPAKWEDGKMVWHDTCREYVNRSVSNATQTCSNGFWFDPASGYESTLTTEFNLVCGKEVYIEISMMTRTIVCGVFGIILNILSDMYGRKTLYMIGIVARPIIGIARAFMPNFYLVEACRLFEDLAMLCFMNNAFILVMEMTAASRRTTLATSMEVFWGLGLVLVTPIVYLCRNWRTLQLVTHVPLFLFYIAFWAPESITWLFSKRKFGQIEKIVRQASRCNKIDPPEDVLEKLREAKNDPAALQPLTKHKDNDEKKNSKSEETKDKTDTGDCGKSTPRPPTFLDLFRTPRVRMYTIVQSFIWFVNMFVYGALGLTMTYMPGNRYTNLFFYALAEVAAAVLHSVLLIKFGRRIPLFAFHVVGGIGLSLTIIEVFKDDLGFNWVPLVVFFNLLGKLGISASFMTIYLYTAEVYPTQIRNLAMSVCQTVATLAGFISPYSRVMERELPGLLRGVCGVLCLIAGFLGLLLPETHNQPLPETIEEVEAMTKKAKHDPPSSGDPDPTA